ncbi:MAG: PCRF domain-containing protein, partial [Chitinophagales bacterium]|nr:PCRF domain-containing protein [Chitinophagales bacterium]
MLDKLAAIKGKWEQVQNELSSPDVIADQARYTRLNRTYKELQKIVDAYEEYKDLLSNLNNAKEILSNEKDEDFKSMAKGEIEELSPKVAEMEETIRLLLIPKDPEDAKNAIVEIRAGTGGDEASIFAGDLFRMYSRYAETKGWKIEVSDYTEGTVGGYKEMIFNVNG